MGVRARSWFPLAWAGLFTILIAGPWLLPGYFFGTDFSGNRYFAFPDTLSSNSGLQLALALASIVLPSEIVGKVMVMSCLFVAGFSAYRAVPAGGFVPRAAAALVYVMNPFVYDRLAYGQLSVLAGYAMLPWAAQGVHKLALKPNAERAIVLAGVLALIAVLDVHMALVAVLVCASLAVAHSFEHVHDRTYLAHFGAYLLLTGVGALAASAYWLVPLVLGIGPEANTLANIGEGDLHAFSATPDPRLGLFPNILGLYGFWAERTGRFISMKEFVAIWPFWLIALLVLAALPLFAVVRRARALQFESMRPWVWGLVLAGAAAVVLEVGVSDPHTARLIQWINVVFPPYRGMRDSGKWAGLLALVYAQMIALGVVFLITWISDKLHASRFREPALVCITAIVLAVPLYYGNGLLYGMHGQIRPSAYPSGWYGADRAMAADPRPARAVFLPWHNYLALSFVRNTNRVVASPAPFFFSLPVVASQDLEVPGIPPPLNDPDQAAISRLVSAGAQGNWAEVLASRDIKYVILAKEVDWMSYSYLERQVGLETLADFGSIIVYRNLSMAAAKSLSMKSTFGLNEGRWVDERSGDPAEIRNRAACPVESASNDPPKNSWFIVCQENHRWRP